MNRQFLMHECTRELLPRAEIDLSTGNPSAALSM